jgi:glycerophosphoryl diester phosphodiesterase
MNGSHALFARLHAAAAEHVQVAAHRGDSRHQPENTLAAFRAATALAVAVQEFDVRQTRDGVLVCIHDAALDRTTDSARRLGPGALVAHTALAELQQLDAGGWFSPAHTGERIPTLAQALETMLPAVVPLLEHKAGPAADYVVELRHRGQLEDCILQSFDWDFVRAARSQAPTLACAVLGPTPEHPVLDRRAIDAAITTGAGMIHWHAGGLTTAAVVECHAAGLLVCSYTTDEELGWVGGCGIGIDLMCSNDPGAMLAAQRRGLLRRRPRA